MSSLFRALFTTSTSKHKKLSENWDSLREPVVEGVTFYCKYLGSCLVDEPKGEVATAEAIKRIIQGAKQESRTPQRVALNVSLRGITAEDAQSNQLLLQTSIYRISYCSADAHYDHVFAYIANNDNDTCECHAYLCPKRKMAQAVTVSIAQAFELAYESWKMETAGTSRDTDEHILQEVPAEAKSKNRKPSIQSCVSSPIAIHSECGSDEFNTSGYASSIMGPATSSHALLIDLEESFEQKPKCRFDKKDMPTKLFMPEDFDVGQITDEFSSLALRHEKPSESAYQIDYFDSGDPLSYSNVWQSAGSSSNESSAATSPTTTTANFFNQSTIASSPNSAFLMMCNSLPQMNGFTELQKSVTQSAAAKNPFQELDPLNSASTTVDPFEALASRQSMTSAKVPFAPISSLDYFMPIQSSEVSTTMASPQLTSGGTTCGARKTAYANQLFQSSDLICS